jgi:hypothetical protein
MNKNQLAQPHFILFNVHDTDRGIYECKGSSVQFEPVKSSTFLKVKGNKLKKKIPHCRKFLNPIEKE